MFQTGRGSTPAARPSPAPRVALKAWPKPAPEPWGETGPSSWPEASVPDLVPRRCQLGRKRSAVGERPNPRTALLPASWACSARLGPGSGRAASIATLLLPFLLCLSSLAPTGCRPEPVPCSLLPICLLCHGVMQVKPSPPVAGPPPPPPVTAWLGHSRHTPLSCGFRG
ncbi:unnamed protein product [Rangifer tarandus platyrhynchus]|uniref:Uncharacterized protein n=1 Tax=Rangifer tarandus platyrhynchus TaxID=3082113 RepID=A0AC59ZHE8_RANTA